MKYPTLILFFVVIGCTMGHCELFDKWTMLDKTLFITACTALAADLYTTKRFRDKGYEESNPILGTEPETRDIALFGVAGMVTIYLMADWLPGYYRDLFLGIMTVNGARNARNNTINCNLEWKF